MWLLKKEKLNGNFLKKNENISKEYSLSIKNTSSYFGKILR
jgi:hypothetical protein